MGGVMYNSYASAASANVSDVLTSEALPRRVATRDGMCEIGLTGSAAGLSLGVIFGDRVIGSNIAPLVKATAPILPDDRVVREPIMAGEIVSISLVNTVAATNTLRYSIKVP